MPQNADLLGFSHKTQRMFSKTYTEWFGGGKSVLIVLIGLKKY